MKHEISAIRAGGSELPATANLMYDYNGLDYKKFKDVMDIASWDNYPSWHKKDNYTTALDGAMQHDLMRSIKKAPFLLMESCPSATNWKPINKLKKPGIHLAASLQAVAHGSDSVLYFQLRQSQGASEKFHGAVIDHYGGDDTRIFREVTEVGEALGLKLHNQSATDQFRPESFQFFLHRSVHLFSPNILAHILLHFLSIASLTLIFSFCFSQFQRTCINFFQFFFTK